MEGEVSRAIEVVEGGHFGKVDRRIVVCRQVGVCDEAKGGSYAGPDRRDDVFFFCLLPGFFPEDACLDFLPLLLVESVVEALAATAAFRAVGVDDFFLFEALGDEPL